MDEITLNWFHIFVSVLIYDKNFPVSGLTISTGNQHSKWHAEPLQITKF